MLSAETYDLQNAVNELLKAENESHSSRNCVRFPEGASVCVCVCVLILDVFCMCTSACVYVCSRACVPDAFVHVLVCVCGSHVSLLVKTEASLIFI